MATEDSQATAHRDIPDDALAIVPVRGVVLFPGVVLPLTLGRDMSVAAAQEAARSGLPVGVLLQRDEAVQQPGTKDLHEIGTVGNILRYVTGADRTHHLIVQGGERFRIKEFLDGFPFLVARVEPIAVEEDMTPAIEARHRHLKERALEALRLFPEAPQEFAGAIEDVRSPSALADLIASFMDLDSSDKQAILETLGVQERLDRVLELVARRIEVMRLSREIGERTKETLDERQREYLLREQMRTIQRELGELEGGNTEIDELREAVDQAQMPAEANEQARKELKRLERMPEASGEHSMVRTYLDWLTALPWNALSEEHIDIKEARRILDAEHYGLEKIKRRILEYLAVRKLNPEGRSPILCFVGPPGVGKTSLGQSIAKAVGLEFARLSLGGVHDESEIRGHRRTYIGSMPGNIIQAIRKAGSRNPVLMLDEMDKLGRSVQGDPSAALLEVLDPEQNSTFRDNYLGVPFDLSKVFFIATANVIDAIPGPLRDRMEIITLPGYTDEEKVEIAKRYLVERQRRANGLRPEQFEITPEALRVIVHEYTREAGARTLERKIGAVCRRAAMRIAEGDTEHVAVRTVEDVREVLGPQQYQNEVALRTSVPGVVTGLAWTPVGGDILFVEATQVPGGSGRLILTGQLGNVMKESAQAALSLVKMHAQELEVDPELFKTHDIHVHVPAGAIPKDGPSAGVAMYTALVSLLTGRTLSPEIAMTGEISLRGQVLPVGGIKEKAVAAARSGIKKVLMPARNRKDLEEIPESARDALEFVWLETVDEAVAAAFGKQVRLERKTAGG